MFQVLHIVLRKGILSGFSWLFELDHLAAMGAGAPVGFEDWGPRGAPSWAVPGRTNGIKKEVPNSEKLREWVLSQKKS